MPPNRSTAASSKGGASVSSSNGSVLTEEEMDIILRAATTNGHGHDLMDILSAANSATSGHQRSRSFVSSNGTPNQGIRNSKTGSSNNAFPTSKDDDEIWEDNDDWWQQAAQPTKPPSMSTDAGFSTRQVVPETPTRTKKASVSRDDSHLAASPSGTVGSGTGGAASASTKTRAQRRTKSFSDKKSANQAAVSIKARTSTITSNAWSGLEVVAEQGDMDQFTDSPGKSSRTGSSTSTSKKRISVKVKASDLGLSSGHSSTGGEGTETPSTEALLDAVKRWKDESRGGGTSNGSSAVSPAIKHAKDSMHGSESNGFTTTATRRLSKKLHDDNQMEQSRSEGLDCERSLGDSSRKSFRTHQSSSTHKSSKNRSSSSHRRTMSTSDGGDKEREKRSSSRSRHRGRSSHNSDDDDSKGGISDEMEGEEGAMDRRSSSRSGGSKSRSVSRGRVNQRSRSRSKNRTGKPKSDTADDNDDTENDEALGIDEEKLHVKEDFFGEERRKNKDLVDRVFKELDDEADQNDLFRVTTVPTTTAATLNAFNRSVDWSSSGHGNGPLPIDGPSSRGVHRTSSSASGNRTRGSAAAPGGVQGVLRRPSYNVGKRAGGVGVGRSKSMQLDRDDFLTEQLASSGIISKEQLALLAQAGFKITNAEDR